MCIFQPFTVKLHPCSYARQSTVIGFRKHCFVLVPSQVFSGSVRFFEYAAYSVGGERLHRECETLRSRGETGDIVSFYWMKSKVYPKCRLLLCALSYKRVCNHCNTGSCARVCVRATRAARRSEWYECTWNIKWRRVRIEFPPGPDRSTDFEKPCYKVSFVNIS